MKALFDQVSIACSRLTTRTYSTSFTFGIWCLHPQLRAPVHSVYGFVRFADEIVDSFHQYPQRPLLERFRRDTWLAIEEKISLNPILNSFQATVHQYGISPDLIEHFLQSMEMDLNRKHYDESGFKVYVTGSAEVVGLMCLRIFCDGSEGLYDRLKVHATSLGSAFQKINFLRDLKADTVTLGRTYFPGMEAQTLNVTKKQEIETSIASDFAHALEGIKNLPRTSRLGVYVAYMYYLALFRKIRDTPAEKVLEKRIRIHNRHKATLLVYSFVKHQLNLI